MTDKGEIVVSKLSAMTVPDAVEQLRLQLVDLLPRPQLTELLIEVDRWASWPDQLTHAGGKTHQTRSCAATSTPRSWRRPATSG